jgi:ankyrin repeat protein
MLLISPQIYVKTFPGYFLVNKLKNYSLDDFSLTDKDETLFMLCCRYQKSDTVLEILKTLPKDKLQISNKNKYNCNAFMYCCRYQSYQVIKYMIDNFTVDELGIQSYDINDITPFFFCCDYQPSDVIFEMLTHYSKDELLISNYTKDGITPLMACCQRQCSGIIEFLINNYKYDLNIGMKSKNGFYTAFNYCCAFQDSGVIFSPLIYANYLICAIENSTLSVCSHLCQPVSTCDKSSSSASLLLTKVLLNSQ